LSASHAPLRRAKIIPTKAATTMNAAAAVRARNLASLRLKLLAAVILPEEEGMSLKAISAIFDVPPSHRRIGG
jgi:hypothetical protein